MRHLLVTNDFPPKVGGIQNLLYECWRRLPPDDVTVLTTSYPGAEAFDGRQPFRVERAGRVLLPTPALGRHVRRLCDEIGANLVVLDPALPLGLVGPTLGVPYAVVVHGAEVAVPARLPVGRELLARALARAERVISFGGYSAKELRRALGGRLPPLTVVPPGVDSIRFHPLSSEERARARSALGLPLHGRLVVSVSRLVPRKGMDVLIEAAGVLRSSMPDLCIAIGGAGRDRHRLERLIKSRGAAGTVRLLGKVPEADLPLLDGAADVWAMVCRDRWGGLEQEGFGLVFLEAAACGVPQLAGRSGGAEEAVVHGETGLVVDRPSDPAAVAAALRILLEDEPLRHKLGKAGRKRAETDFDYEVVAQRLGAALDGDG